MLAIRRLKYLKIKVTVPNILILKKRNQTYKIIHPIWAGSMFVSLNNEV